MFKSCFAFLFGFFFNVEALHSAHYSVVNTGVDRSIEANQLLFNAVQCETTRLGEFMKIVVEHEQPSEFLLTAELPITEEQNVQIKFQATDFLRAAAGDYYPGHVSLNFSLEYSDGLASETKNFECSTSCVDGSFDGSIVIENKKTDNAQLRIHGMLHKQDLFLIRSIDLGDLVLRTEVFEESVGIVQSSCNGRVAASVFFGKAGVGKSTVASLVSSEPALFGGGSNSQGTTTLGAWISDSVPEGTYAEFADTVFFPGENSTLEQNDLLEFYQNSTNLVWIDTEGLDYQTEYGENYDMVTILPHTLIGENVFLLVRDRVNPAEVSRLVDKMVNAAKKVEGAFLHRNDKVFGHFTIVVNKAQDISKSDETELDLLKTNNPSLILKIKQYFTSGPDIVLLPLLRWNYGDEPDFSQENFVLDYQHIALSHPPLRERMFYGLHKIAASVVENVPIAANYTKTCENFENELQELYLLSSEDVIDINQFNYNWLLKEAEEKLSVFVQGFGLSEVGLTMVFQQTICPETDSILLKCINSQVDILLQSFYQQCLEKIDAIFADGSEDLKFYLDEILFPTYVQREVSEWFETCIAMKESDDLYSDSYIMEFEGSDFFESCKTSVTGRYEYDEWTECSKPCKDNDRCGRSYRYAKACKPSYSVCLGLQVLSEDCNCEPCVDDSIQLPAGSIIPWVQRPNIHFNVTNVSLKSYQGWIECDGNQICDIGIFKGQSCPDTANRALIGAGNQYPFMTTHEATMPNHTHPHNHTTVPHRHSAWKTGPNRASKTTPSGSSDSGTYAQTTGEATVIVNDSSAWVGEIKSHGGGSPTGIGDLYPRNLRVKFLFKCG